MEKRLTFSLKKIPDGDVLLHSGDFTRTGTPAEIESFTSWLREQPHKFKVVIAGNHDLCLDPSLEGWPTLEKLKIITEDFAAARELVAGAGLPWSYLQDSEVEIDGFRIWGSPLTPRSWGAFQLDEGSQDIRDAWRAIPEGIDVVMTHGPAYGQLDEVPDYKNRNLGNPRLAGCRDLLAELTGRVQPAVHVFGHIHECHGVREANGIHFVNAANCNVQVHTQLRTNAPS